jgi:hypothetical protein
MGEVSEGRITLQDQLIQVTLGRGDLKIFEPQAFTNEAPFFDYNDYLCDSRGKSHIPSGTMVFILPVVVSKTFRRRAGLILRRMSETSVYERCGYVEFIQQELKDFVFSADWDGTYRKVAEAGLEFVDSVLKSLPSH